MPYLNEFFYKVNEALYNCFKYFIVTEKQERVLLFFPLLNETTQAVT